MTRYALAVASSVLAWGLPMAVAMRREHWGWLGLVAMTVPGCQWVWWAVEKSNKRKVSNG